MKRNLFSHSADEKGNALFLVLIALALFAALAFAITQSGRSGGGTVTKEQMTLGAARLINSSNFVKQTILRLMLITGCTDQQIEIHPTGNLHSGDYGGPPNGTTCNVFLPAGGGLSFPADAAPQDLAAEGLIAPDCYPACPNISGDNAVSGVGTAAADLVYYEPVFSLDFCNELNRQLGLPATTSAIMATIYSRFHYGFYFANMVTPAPASGDRHSACMSVPNGGWPTAGLANLTPSPAYIFYAVMIDR